MLTQDFTNKMVTILDRAGDRLPEVVLTTVFGIIAVEIAIFILSRGLRVTRIPAALRRILESLGRTFLWIILFLVIIQTLGLNNVIVAVTGSSVIVALFLSTGVAPIITDILSGLFLAGDRDFAIGATVRAGDKDTEGVVADMDIRKVRIRAKTGKIHVVPNSLVEKNEWVILKAAPASTKARKWGRLKKSA